MARRRGCRRRSVHAVAQDLDAPDDLMAGHERQLGLRVSSPSRICRWCGHTPQAVTLIRTWFALGAGTGNSAALSGVPTRSSTIACMVAEGMAPSPLRLGWLEALISVQREAELLAHHLGALKRQRMRW